MDVAIEALGTQATFEACLDATRPGGIVSSLGVYGGKLEMPLESYVYGIGDKQILTTLCPGGKERMRELMELVRRGRLDLDTADHAPFLTGRDRGGLRALRQPARRRRQGRTHAVTQKAVAYPAASRGRRRAARRERRARAAGTPAGP